MKNNSIQWLGGVLTAVAGVSSLHAQESERGFILEEIVVTAQKRVEKIQDVPVSMSVMSAAQLERLGAVQLTDYAGYVPGLVLDNDGAPGMNTITLRGVSAGASASSTVGVYLGDAPVGSSSAYAQGGRLSLDLLPYDIERIEVLRGPQGTLYGASTLGGLLKYVMRSPDLDSFSGRVGGETSRIQGADDIGWGARAYVNVPVVAGKVALRASVSEQDSAGYIDNAATNATDENDTSQFVGRAALLWQVSDQLSVELGMIHQKIETDAQSIVQLDAVTGRPAFGDLASAHLLPESSENELRIYTATLQWQLGDARLTSATSYARTKFHQSSDQTDELNPFLEPVIGPALYPAGIDLELDKFTQEIRLASPEGGTIEWLLGGFYTEEDSANLQTIRVLEPGGTPFFGLDPAAYAGLPSRYRETAFFGDFTYKFTESFDVTTGVRWARNRQAFQQIDLGGNVVPVGEAQANASDSVVTYMFSPRLRINPGTMLYARVASGYRPGGPNVAMPGVQTTYEADELVNYELGLKSDFADGRALIDLAVFYLDWSDIQLVTVGGAGTTALVNGGSAKSQGIELTTAYSPLKDLRLGLTAAYTQAELTEDMPPLAGLAGQSGDRLPSAPRWSGALTFDYAFLHRGEWTAALGGGYRYVGERFGDFVAPSTPRVRLASYGMSDLNATLSNDRYTFRLFARNLGDKRAYADAVTVGAFAPVDASVLTPRVVGLSADVNF